MSAPASLASFCVVLSVACAFLLLASVATPLPRGRTSGRVAWLRLLEAVALMAGAVGFLTMGAAIAPNL